MQSINLNGKSAEKKDQKDQKPKSKNSLKIESSHLEGFDTLSSLGEKKKPALHPFQSTNILTDTARGNQSSNHPLFNQKNMDSQPMQEMHPNSQFYPQQQQMYPNSSQQGYQQQMFLPQYDQQIRRMMYEQDTLKRELEQERKERMEIEKKLQNKSERTALRSRDRERNGLAMLSAFEQVAGIGTNRGFGDFFKQFGGTDPQPAEPPTPNKRLRESAGPNLGSQHYSPNTFQNTASMMMSPNYGIAPQGTRGYRTSQPQNVQQSTMNSDWRNDPQFIIKLLELSKSNRTDIKPQKNYLAELVSASLEKQNAILSALTRGGGSEEVNHFSSREKEELDRKIARLEMELGLRSGDSLDLHSMSSGRNPHIRNHLHPEHHLSHLNPFGMGMGMGMNMFNAANPFSMMKFPSTAMSYGINPKTLAAVKKANKNKFTKSKQAALEKLLMTLGLDEKEGDDEKDERDQDRDYHDDYDKSMPPMRREGNTRVFDNQNDNSTRKGTFKQDKNSEAVEKALAEERAKQEEAKKKEEAKAAKEKRKTKLRALLWLRMWPCLFQNFANSKCMDKRSLAMETHNTDLGLVIDGVFNWCKTASAKGMQKIISEIKKPLIISDIDGKKPKDSDLAPRCQNIAERLNQILNGMDQNTTEELLPKQAVIYFSKMAFDRGFLPQTFIFDMELHRFTYNSFGGLKDQSPEKTKMILMFFFIVRIMVHRIILNPVVIEPKFKKDTSNKNNLRTLASVFVHAVCDWVRQKAFVVNGNTNHLPNELKTKPANPLKAFPEESIDAPKKKEDVTSVMLGIFTKEEIKPWTANKPLDNALKASIEGWATKLYQILLRVHTENLKKETENSRGLVSKLVNLQAVS